MEHVFNPTLYMKKLRFRDIRCVQGPAENKRWSTIHIKADLSNSMAHAFHFHVSPRPRRISGIESKTNIEPY